MAVAVNGHALTNGRALVYLHTFPTTPHCYSLCPFAIKVESWLRVNAIPYEVVHTKKFSSKGQMPYVKVDCEEIPDSNVIIPKLALRFFGATYGNCDSQLTSQQRAITHTCLRTLEEHTTQIGFYYRYGLNMAKLGEVLSLKERFGTPPPDAPLMKRLLMRFGIFMWLKCQPKATKNNTAARRLLRHSQEELWGFSFEDLQALSDMLGDKAYFHGSSPTTADCIIFGHLTQLLYIPLDFPQKEFIESKCPNLKQLCERFRAEYWPDWEQKCEPSGDTPQATL